MNKVSERNIALAIVFTLITCGIYGIYWFIVMTNEVKEVSGDENVASGGLAFVFTLITCGIYGIYWAYKMGELLKETQEKNNLTVSANPVLYLILDFLGLSIVSYALIQNELNKFSSTNVEAGA